MLARLDQDLAPLRAAVDREGTVLRLDGPAQPDVATRVPAILGETGYVAEPIDTAQPVSRWFGSEEVDELSQEEARVLAERWAKELAGEAVIDEPQRLIHPLRAALFEAFQAAARTGVVDTVRIDAASFRGILDEADAEPVRQWIERKLGRHTAD